MRYANASWFKSLTDNISLNAGFNQNIDDNRDRSLYLMVTITTDNNLSASSTLQRTNDETGYQLNASLTPPADGGWGWNLAASQQASGKVAGEKWDIWDVMVKRTRDSAVYRIIITVMQAQPDRW